MAYRTPCPRSSSATLSSVEVVKRLLLMAPALARALDISSGKGSKLAAPKPPSGVVVLMCGVSLEACTSQESTPDAALLPASEKV